MIATVIAAAALASAQARQTPPSPLSSPHAIMGYSWSDVAPECRRLVSFGTRRLTLENLDDPAGMKAVTDRMPAGRRVIFLWDVAHDLLHHPDDRCRDASGALTPHQGVWPEAGVRRVAERIERFLYSYRALGGKLDLLVLDFEDGLSNWHLGADLARWRAIEADPRFAPLRERLGFGDLGTVAEWWKQSGDVRRNYLRWNALQHERVADALNRAVFLPARRLYPRVQLSNYGHRRWSRALGVPDLNGHREYLFGSGAHVGTHQSCELYGWLGQIRENPPDGVPSYPHTPFNSFRHALNKMRSMAGSSRVPIHPWIANRGFVEQYCGLRNHDLWQEVVFHAGLGGADAFLFWNARTWPADTDPTIRTDDAQDLLFDRCLQVLDRLIGKPGRRTLSRTLVPWDSGWALTGMLAGGRTVWRFTPNADDGANPASALVREHPATFRVGDETIVIPGGRVAHVAPRLSAQGFWVIAPASVRAPVVRRAE